MWLLPSGDGVLWVTEHPPSRASASSNPPMGYRSPRVSSCCRPGAGPASGPWAASPKAGLPPASFGVCQPVLQGMECPCMSLVAKTEARELFPAPPSLQPLPQLIIQCPFQSQTDFGSPPSPNQSPPDISAVGPTHSCLGPSG